MFSLKDILRQHGYPVEPRRELRIGCLVYGDHLQVVAAPLCDSCAED